MDCRQETIEAEYKDNDIVVSSTDPLRGVLELAADNDQIVEVVLNRESAVALLAAVARFLTRDEGSTAPLKNSVQ